MIEYHSLGCVLHSFSFLAAFPRLQSILIKETAVCLFVCLIVAYGRPNRGSNLTGLLRDGGFEERGVS